jgi:hypothetical protein
LDLDPLVRGAEVLKCIDMSFTSFVYYKKVSKLGISE